MRSPFLVALIHPLNLAMLGVSAVAGLVSAWWLFPVGLLFWLIMVIAVARDPSLRFNAQMQNREPLAQRFQRYFDRIERAQVSIFNSLASAPPGTRRVLEPVRDEIDKLTSSAHALCRRMTTLENYRVVSQSQSDLKTDLQRIEGVLESTRDPAVRREYEESRRSLEERLGKLSAVSAQLDRVEAQLLSLANEMDGIVTEVVRLQAMGPDPAKRQVPAIVQQLHDQVQEIEMYGHEVARL